MVDKVTLPVLLFKVKLPVLVVKVTLPVSVVKVTLPVVEVMGQLSRTVANEVVPVKTGNMTLGLLFLQ